MKTVISLFAGLLMASMSFAADETLRIDYIFSGNDRTADISLDELSRFDGWAGRTVNMSEVPLRGNGMIMMKDKGNGRILYAQSFSTLFQEWQCTEEAVHARRSFEGVFLLPMPDSTVEITVNLFDIKGNVSASLTHDVDPTDILIRRLRNSDVPARYVLESGSPSECIDVAIVAEGYSEDEADKFYDDAKKAVESILAHEPFRSYKDRFNFIAVALPSADSGVSVPSAGVWKDTALKSHFDTFHMDRYLTTLRIRLLHDRLVGIPYEHIVILANTDTYGGGGIYNSYTLTTAGHEAFAPVVVHEFGHSFAGLADEYYYDDMFVEYYYPDIEPWEQNITTLHDFSAKWEDMLPEGAVIPSQVKDGCRQVGVYEGAGYQSKGVFRGYPDCRMKTNSAVDFCPVCRRAVSRIIEFYTREASR